MTTEERAFLKAIKAAPADDLPRLVYADWLDENAGAKCPQCDPAKVAYCTLCKWGRGWLPDARRPRADFIRVQIELSKLNRSMCSQPMKPGRTGRAKLAGPVTKWVNCGVCRWCELSTRQARLYATGGAVVLEDSPLRSLVADPNNPIGHGRFRWGFSRGFVETVEMPFLDYYGGECDNCFGGELVVGGVSDPDNGPPRVVGCQLCDGDGKRTALGPLIAAAHPLRVVQFSDCRPLEVHDTITGVERVWSWWNVESGLVYHDDSTPSDLDTSDLPADLWRLILEEIPVKTTDTGFEKKFREPVTAFSALSEAAVLWAELKAEEL